MRLPGPRVLRVPAPVGLAVLGVAEAVVAGHRPWATALALPLLGGAVLLRAPAVPLAAPPLVALLYAAAPLGGFDVSRSVAGMLLVAWACFAAGRWAPRRAWPAGVAAVVVANLVAYAGLALGTDFEPDLLFGLAVGLAAWGSGLGLRDALERERAAGAAAERRRDEASVLVERAVLRERRRVVVEVHDVLVHRLSGMVVQAAAAAELLRRDRGRAETLLTRVAQTGREALAETGRSLRLLRDQRPVPPPPQTPLGERPPAAHRRAWSRDLLLPLAVGSLATAEALLRPVGHSAAELTGAWVAVAALAVRRAHPLAVPLVVTVAESAPALLGLPTGDSVSALLLLWLALFDLGRLLPRRRRGGGLAVALACVAILVGVDQPPGPADVVLITAAVLGPWGCGLAVRSALDRARAVGARAERERLDAEAAREGALVVERRRLAHELHDVLAGSLSIMTVQSAAAAELAPQDLRAALAAARAVQDCGRTALASTGSLLARLADGTGAATTEPAPATADLAALADRFVRGGVEVDLVVGPLPPLPLPVDVSVYRIVEEALANAVKHAPGARVRVEVRGESGSVLVRAVNGPARAPGRPAPSSGLGLVGLRERVALLGGRLESAPIPEGGFAVTATLPVVDAPSRPAPPQPRSEPVEGRAR